MLRVLLDENAGVDQMDAHSPNRTERKSNAVASKTPEQVGSHPSMRSQPSAGADATPLMLASRYGHVHAVKVLLDDGRQHVNEADHKGWTSLHRAASAGHMRVIEMLIDHNADIDVVAPQRVSEQSCGITALAAAAKSGHVKAVALLLQHKANMQLQNINGDTPLLIACIHGHEAVVRTLCPTAETSGPSVQAGRSCLAIKSHLGRTPLMAAAEMGAKEVVRYLLECMRPPAKNEYSSDLVANSYDDMDVVEALKLARKGGHVSVAYQLLRKLGDCHTLSGSAFAVYACHQQTFYAQQRRDLWLEGKRISCLRLSMPPFNKPPPGVLLPDMSEQYEVPVFGLRISRAIMECFDLDGLPQVAQELGITLPRYGLSGFIQGKMFKVRRLISEARKRDDCQSGVNAEAISRLERFVEAFAALRTDEIDGPDAWHRWVSSFTADDWMEKQEFSHLLSNFGFSPETAKEIQLTEIDDRWDDGSTVKTTLEQYSLRWLSKAFAGYNVVGCLTDVANLIFAMKGKPPTPKPTEEEVVIIVREVAQKLREGEFKGLWIPTHMIHDAETDDLLSWLLLKYVNRGSAGSSLQVVFGHPPNPHSVEFYL